MEDTRLLALITRFYGEENISSDEMLRALRDFEGYPEIKDWQVKNIRQKLAWLTGAVDLFLVRISSKYGPWLLKT